MSKALVASMGKCLRLQVTKVEGGRGETAAGGTGISGGKGGKTRRREREETKRGISEKDGRNEAEEG